MPESQRALYEEIFESSKRAIASRSAAELEEDIGSDEEDGVKKPASKPKKKPLEAQKSASANILMDLRKAALHPLLFRRHYTDAIIQSMAKDCLKEKRFKDGGLQYIAEDLSVCLLSLSVFIAISQNY